jgi:hypothetical protein
VEVDVPIDSEMFFVTDFVYLNIKPVQSFKCAHKSSIYVRVFIGMSVHICMAICVYTVFLKKKKIRLWNMKNSTRICSRIEEFSFFLEEMEKVLTLDGDDVEKKT